MNIMETEHGTVITLDVNDIESAIRQFICACHPALAVGRVINLAPGEKFFLHPVDCWAQRTDPGNEKTTRCTSCAAEFTDEEIRGAQCCPRCGHHGLPMDMRNDVTIRINLHELRVLGIWAEHYASKVDQDNLDNPAHESLKQAVEAICGRIRQQLAQMGKDAPLTLTSELSELQCKLKTGSVQLFRNGTEEIIPHAGSCMCPECAQKSKG